jgi:hypothetical protein
MERSSLVVPAKERAKNFGALDERDASFDKLRMRIFLNAIKDLPHPEPVEGRTMGMQLLTAPERDLL